MEMLPNFQDRISNGDDFLYLRIASLGDEQKKQGIISVEMVT